MSRPPDQQRAWVEIDLGRLERNLHRIRAALPPHLSYIAVVKADAYGHGLPAVAARLMRCGADLFAVANLGEAAVINETGGGWPILILSPLLPAEIAEAVRLGVIPVISSLAEAQLLSAAAARAGRTVLLHLKVDTGMGRLGVWYTEARALYRAVAALPNLAIGGVCTHFAAADTDPPFTALQRQRFVAFVQELAPAVRAPLIIHADNSAGLDSFPSDGPFNGARVGLLQFGVHPHAASLLGAVAVEPVLSFHTRVGLVKDLPAGTAVSYGLTHRLGRDSRIAVLTAGYGDGIPTALSNCGEVLIHGRRAPIIGRVTMDQTIVDVSAIPQTAPGDLATLVGDQDGACIDVGAFARLSGQIEWEVFCSISQRVARFYRTDTGW
jgi:alanine racemase